MNWNHSILFRFFFLRSNLVYDLPILCQSWVFLRKGVRPQSLLWKLLGTTHYGRNEVLTQVMIAGIAELDGDAVKVLGFFDNNSFNVVNNFVDPAIVNFSLEITLRLKDDAKRLGLSNTVQRTIVETQTHLIRRLIEIKRHDFQG